MGAVSAEVFKLTGRGSGGKPQAGDPCNFTVGHFSAERTARDGTCFVRFPFGGRAFWHHRRVTHQPGWFLPGACDARSREGLEMQKRQRIRRGLS